MTVVIRNSPTYSTGQSWTQISQRHVEFASAEDLPLSYTVATLGIGLDMVSDLCNYAKNTFDCDLKIVSAIHRFAQEFKRKSIDSLRK